MSVNKDLFSELLSCLQSIDSMHRDRLDKYELIRTIEDKDEQEKVMKQIYEIDHLMNVARFEFQRLACNIKPLEVQKRFGEVDSAYLKFLLSDSIARRDKSKQDGNDFEAQCVGEDYVVPLTDLINRTCI